MLIQCYLCGSKHYEVQIEYFEKDIYEENIKIDNDFFRKWVKCNDCGLIYSLRSYKFDTSIYQRTYRSKEVQGKNAKEKFEEVLNLPYRLSENKQRIKRLLTSLPKNYLPTIENKKKVLDIGCGMGIFLFEFLNDAWMGYAIDPDKAQLIILKKKIHLKTKNCFYRRGIFQEKFDLIVITHVLEHIEDPISFLQDVKCDIKDDGYIFIELPDASNIYLQDKNHDSLSSPHFYFFDFYTLSLLIKKVDLKIVNLQFFTTPTNKYRLHLLVRK